MHTMAIGVVLATICGHERNTVRSASLALGWVASDEAVKMEREESVGRP